ncbi:MAG TPA: pyrroline-5-carboxylate reductase [Acidobacteriaceae bacterium]|nr:pyrroline-5-carboxylate reductase [Acidobacteriaceae bacterium]
MSPAPTLMNVAEMPASDQPEGIRGRLPGRVAVLGAGKMGGILTAAFLRTGLLQPVQIVTTVAHNERARTLESRLGVRCLTDNRAAAEGADIILLGVKPTQIADLVREIQPHLTTSTVLISIAASVTIPAIEAIAGEGIPVIRAMPNTPATLGAGMTALVRGRFATAEHMATAEQMFRTVGRTVTLDEKHMDAVTGLSGSGPAFLYIILEALAEAGVNVGLPRDIATELAAQTAYGAARMVLETGAHPALLKDEVTTPAGCTVDGILELEEGGLRVTLIKAVKRATERARALARG